MTSMYKKSGLHIKVTPIIDNWSYVNGSIWGNVYKHERYPEGKQISTAKIVEHGDNGIVHTAESTFQLGVMAKYYE